ncbi:STAS domain-containing protein [Mycobacterium sp. NPDC050041]|uniref:STAS domain-containing protein n=1 Tax=Mycobacterium sp. NPDC050041 TaxID=3364293 RepID=UPI003C2C1AF5
MDGRISLSSTTTTLPGIELTEARLGSAIVISVGGCVDMRTAAELTTAIEQACSEKPAGGVIVDLTGVRFLAAAGINSLLAARWGSAAAGFGVVAAGPVTSRPITVLGLNDDLALFSTVDDALVGLTAA